MLRLILWVRRLNSYMNIKKCSKCKVEKPISCFNKNKSKKDGLQHSCRECRKASWDKEYQNNRKSYLKKRKRQALAGRIRLKNFKKDLTCVICHEPESCCLSFHHLTSFKKNKNVSCMQYFSDKNFYNEIKKCVCLCENCHRKVHNGILKLP